MITQPARKISSFALTITMLALFSACSSHTVQRSERQVEPLPANQGRELGERAAGIALQQVGVPYRYGGSNRNGFDCSGLVHFSYGKAGKRVPRTTGQLWSSTSTVARNELQMGDLLFFKINGKMSHVGVYVGGQRFVHAPSSGRTVSVESLTSPYYASAMIRAGRPK